MTTPIVANDDAMWDYWVSPTTEYDDAMARPPRPVQQPAAQSTWNPWGSQVNVWNTQNLEADGSVPWDVAMQMGIGPGAHYGASGSGSGSSSRLYANTSSDAYLNSALARLQGTVNGTSLPFDATTRDNMLSKAGDMNAAAEASNADDVRSAAAAGGGSLNDPATQAALRQLKSTRQQGNQQAAQAIDMQANLANFGAQQTAANSLAGTRLQQAQVDPYYNGAPKQFTGTSWGGGGSAGGGGTASSSGSTGAFSSVGTNNQPPIGSPGSNTGPNLASQSPALAAAYQGGYRPTTGATDWRTQWREAQAALYGAKPIGAFGWQ